jgi:hypothetical protein
MITPTNPDQKIISSSENAQAGHDVGPVASARGGEVFAVGDVADR